MRTARRIRIIAGALAAGLLIPETTGHAQSATDLIGAWRWVSVEISSGDGRKLEPMGPGPLGHVLFDGSGRFAYLVARQGRLRFAGSSREEGTADENREAMRGALAMSGTYSLTRNVLTFKIEASTYPNLEGTERKVTLVSLNADELSYSNPTPSNAGGGTAIAVARRVK